MFPQGSVSTLNLSLVIPQEPKLAFEDVDATELYPCVMFYSSNPGEKVREPKCSLKKIPVIIIISVCLPVCLT